MVGPLSLAPVIGEMVSFEGADCTDGPCFMLTLSFDRRHGVARLKFTGLLTGDDLDMIDPVLVGMAGGAYGAIGPNMRCLYDMSHVNAILVPQKRFAERASKPAIGNMMRVVVAPPWAGERFGESYRSARGLWPHDQPMIVESLDEAYSLLSVVLPQFELLSALDS